MVNFTFDLQGFLSSVNGGRSIATYKKNGVVFRQGDEADSVFYIVEGECKLSIVSEQGKEAVIALPKKGDFVGEGCLCAQQRRMATVTAITKCTLMRIGKVSMVRVLHDQPEFSGFFLSHLLARNARIESDLVDQLFNSSEKRLARLLLLMANFGKEGTPDPVVTKISQETLADMIGTTRARVSFFMNKFRKLGFIEYDSDFRVHSSLLNVLLYDTPAIKRDGQTKKLVYRRKKVPLLSTK